MCDSSTNGRCPRRKFRSFACASGSWPSCSLSAEPRIERIVVRTPFTVGRMNCYAINGDPFVLIDPGPASDDAMADLAAGVRRLGRRIEDVEVLLLTHQHADHTGGAARVKALSGCVVMSHPGVLPLLADTVRAAERELEFQAAVMRRHGVSKAAIVGAVDMERRFHDFIEPVEVDVALEEGPIEAVPALEARFRPGHSPTDVVFAAESGLLTGDHLLPAYPSLPLVHLGGSAAPLLTYRASLARTAAEPAARGLPGHGDTIADTAATARAWLGIHDRRARRVAAALTPDPVTAYALVETLLGPAAPALSYLRLCEILGSLSLLAHRGLAAVTEDEGRIMWRVGN